MDAASREEQERRGNICGERNPGFNLWTSAHGFHHFSLTNSRPWKVFWVLVVLACVLGLLVCIIFYFYYVFSTAVYSRIIIESPDKRTWPNTIVCEKQAFRYNKIQTVSGLTLGQVSLLTWSLDGTLARPSVAEESASSINSLETQLNNTLQQDEFAGDHDKLIRAASPSCQEFILECQLGNEVLSAAECCSVLFNSEPVINQYGTCFSMKGTTALRVSQAGEGNGLQVVTLHQDFALFDKDVYRSDVFGASGVNFAVADPHLSVETAMRINGQSATLNSFVSIGIGRTVIDNSDLEFSLIGRMECTALGASDPADVNSDFLIGLDKGLGYARDNCLTAKDELLAREVVGCSFNPDTSYKRCSPGQSATYYRSFLDANKTGSDQVSSRSMSSSVKDRHSATCPQDCTQDRYSLTASSSPFTDNQKADLAEKIPSGVQNSAVVVLKFYLNSLEYQRIHNFPQHGMQFTAEVGGLMAFFLGISIISVLEWFCYCLFFLRRTCCKCFDSDDQDPPEELPPPRWKKGARQQVHDDPYAQRRRSDY